MPNGPARSEPSLPRPWLFGGAALLVLGLTAAVLSLISGREREPRPPIAAAPPDPPPAVRSSPEDVAARTEPALEVPTDPEEAETAEDAHSHEPGDHPHAITPEHQRLYRENNLTGSIDGAIQVKDYEGIRRLNAQYRAEYPEDDHVLQDAYDMIADCIEEKTPERVARAREFWETRRSSRARRDLRRHCLE